MTSVLMKDRRREDSREMRGRGEDGLEIGVMQSQAKKCLEPPETERGKEGFSPRLFGGRADPVAT